MPSVCRFCHGVLFLYHRLLKSSFKPEFLSSTERKYCFEEQGKPNCLLVLGDFHIFPTIKVNVDQQLFGFALKEIQKEEIQRHDRTRLRKTIKDLVCITVFH